MYSINGKFLARDINGQIRVAIELIKCLDKIIPENYMEIVAPWNSRSIDGLSHIRIIRFGKCNSHLWEQTFYYIYILKNRRIALNFLNSHPFFRPDIAYIHDTLYDAYPKMPKTFYGKVQKLYIKVLLLTSTKYAKEIVTVSEYSKSEILKYYKVDKEKIHVIHNAWQHMNTVIEDDSVLVENNLKKYDYLLSISGLTPQKNYNWIRNNAFYNQNDKYVIAGKVEKSTQDYIGEKTNILYIGRVSDEKMKALMHYCKAFIHPAIYEGFALTPLEAIACGCEDIVVSNSACLPEIYGDCVNYLNPYIANVNINSLINNQHPSPFELLNKYSWEKSARRLKEILDMYI